MRTLAEWLTLQESVHPKSIDLGLARIARVARALKLDQPPFAVITVGGTNGKGSTVAHLDALLRAAGVTTGMFTSPHLVRYNERIRVAGQEASDGELVAAFERIEAVRGDTTLTFFEFNALAALLIFVERAVDVAILEVGLGGRLDAANLLDADVAVLCSIGFDHRDWLGDTLELIGAEKAGIFRPGRPAVLGTADMPSSVYSAIQALGAYPVVAGQEYRWEFTPPAGPRWNYDSSHLRLRDLPPSALEGAIQYRNAATAIAAVEALLNREALAGGGARRSRIHFDLDERLVARALEDVRLAGRFQIVPGPVEWILDIAHNEPAAVTLAGQLRQRPLPPAPPERVGRARTFAVIGILGDKDAGAIGGVLDPIVDQWILCTLEGPRGITAADLARRMQLPAGKTSLADSVAAGCELARARAQPGDRVVVFGSFHAVGPALQWLEIY